MIRVSNRNHSEKQIVVPQIQYVDRPIERIVETKAPDAIIQYVDRVVVQEVQVPGDTIVMEKEVDLKPLHDKHAELEAKLLHVGDVHNRLVQVVSNELENQRKALVALKKQRDIDRKRRLQLLKRLKKHRDEHKKSNLKLKLAIGASLLLSIVSLIAKL
jgi:hypothetical protein